MKATIKHTLGKDTAIARVKHALVEAKPKLAEQGGSMTEEWNGNILSFGVTGQGQTITGTLTITEDAFEIYAKLPLALRLFEGRIEKMIQEAAQQALKA